jgi:hypothetical protein
MSLVKSAEQELLESLNFLTFSLVGHQFILFWLAAAPSFIRHVDVLEFPAHLLASVSVVVSPPQLFLLTIGEASLLN